VESLDQQLSSSLVLELYWKESRPILDSLHDAGEILEEIYSVAGKSLRRPESFIALAELLNVC